MVGMMTGTTRDRILASAHNVKPDRLEVPEWGPEPVYIRVLSAKDQLALSENVEQKDIPFRVLVDCICDETGTPIFQPGDEDALKELPFPVVMRVFAVAAKVNGLSSKELEEAVASFAPAQGGDISSE